MTQQQLMTMRETIERYRATHPVHVLVIKPCEGCEEAGEPTCSCEPQQWEVSIQCPGVTDACRTWWECMECAKAIAGGNDDLRDELGENGEAHGVEHRYLENGWSVPGPQCWGQECPDLYDAAVDLFKKGPIEPGEYRVRLIPDDQYLSLDLVTDEGEQRVDEGLARHEAKQG